MRILSQQISSYVLYFLIIFGPIEFLVSSTSLNQNKKESQSPTNIRFEELDDESVKIVWQPVKDVQKYIVSYKRVGNRNEVSTTSNTNTIEIKGLSPGTEYTVTISSVKFKIMKFSSQPKNFRTCNRIAPQNVSVTVLNPVNAYVSWTMPIDEVQKCIVSYKAIGSEDPKIVTTKSTSTVLHHLKDDTKYKLSVVAIRLSKRYKSKETSFHNTHRIVLYYNTSIFETLDLKLLENLPIARRPNPFDYDREYYKLSNAILSHHNRRDPNKISSLFKFSVSRKNILNDTFDMLMKQKTNLSAFLNFVVTFDGEPGKGVGILREWYRLFSHQAFHPNFKLFKYSDKVTSQVEINPDSEIAHPNKHLLYFELLGMFTAAAIWQEQYLQVNLALPFLKTILHRPISLDDVRNSDLEFYGSLSWIRDTDQTSEEFMFIAPESTNKNIIELKKNGANIKVDEDNKIEYIRLMINWRYIRRVEVQTAAFLRGFRAIIPLNHISIFNEYELQKMIGGEFKIDIKFWKSCTTYKEGYTETSNQVQWFWKAVTKFTDDQRIRLLYFVTGSSRFAVDGSRKLTFYIKKSSSDTNTLPTAVVCRRNLYLPEYETYEKLRQKLTQVTEFETDFAHV